MRDINFIIFSKDRACQLELFIRSMKEYFKEFNECDIRVLYTFSTPEFEQGYEKLKLIHTDPNLIYFNEDYKFQTSLLSQFNQMKKLSVFFVDDNVFKEPFSLEDEKFKIFLSKPEILTLSLRLHPRLDYCYPANLKQSIPSTDKFGAFNWYQGIGDFGYPMSLDGHFFRTEHIIYYLYNLRYNGPNDLESQMAMRPVPIPYMICYDKSRIINLPLNKVQNFNNNIHGHVDAKFLNDNFLNGKIISLNNIRGFENHSCHQEIEVDFEEI
jgi:hypothetical protein